MNNKKGGFGAKFLLVLILMIASAVGGAYAYRVLDGKMAVRDAQRVIESVKVSDYDTEEAVTIQEYIDNATKDLDTAVTRKEVYEIMESFNSDVDKVLTKTEKELEEARQAVKDASNNNSNNSSSNNSSNSISNDSSSDTSSDDTSDDESSGGLFGGIFGGNSDSEETEDTEDNSGV